MNSAKMFSALTAMFLAAGSTGNAAAGESRSGLKENLLSLLRIPSITSSVEENNRAVGVLKGWLDARAKSSARPDARLRRM